MNGAAEHRFTLMPARMVAKILLAVVGTWAGSWLVLALVALYTAPSELPSTGFFLALLPMLLLIPVGPAWGLGGTLVVTTEPGRLVVRRDRIFRRGTPVVVAVPPGARLDFAVERMRGRHRSYGKLLVSAGPSLTRIDQTAGFTVLSQTAAALKERLAVSARPS